MRNMRKNGAWKDGKKGRGQLTVATILQAAIGVENGRNRVSGRCDAAVALCSDCQKKNPPGNRNDSSRDMVVVVKRSS